MKDMTDPKPGLSDFRSRIDSIDKEIVRLIQERASLARKVGEEKRKSGMPVFRPDREKEVYENVGRVSKELFGDSPPLPVVSLEHIYREIMSGSIAIEGGPGVAYLGPQASFSHLAVRLRFGSSIREYPEDSIGEVFRAVEAGQEVSYGMVPVDNTLEGSIGQTMDLLLTSELKIYAEHYLRVNINLLCSQSIPLESVKKIYTLRIAREQCRVWLQQNLNMANVEVVEMPSTSAAARSAQENGDGCAIGSELAAETYGLNIIARNIQDNPNNLTRFFIIGTEQCPPTGDDKTSIICGVRDNPGSLYRLLQPFHDAGLNLTRIESRATRKSYGDFNFYIDFEGHRQDPKIAALLKTIEERTSLLKILGSYPKAAIPGT